MNSTVRKSSSSTSTPKLVIKPFKVQPKIPDNFEDISWAKLESAINAVFKKIPTEVSKEVLYQCVEDLCIHKLSSRLYTNLRVEVEAHIIKMVAYLKQISSDQHLFLRTVDEVWRDFIDQVSTIRNIFLYLDRTYALVTNGIKSVWDLSLELAAHHLLIHTDIIDRIVRALVTSIDAGRRGQFVDRDFLRRIVRMLMFLGLYSSRFEGPFLQVRHRTVSIVQVSPCVYLNYLFYDYNDRMRHSFFVPKDSSWRRTFHRACLCCEWSPGCRRRLCWCSRV